MARKEDRTNWGALQLAKYSPAGLDTMDKVTGVIDIGVNAVNSALEVLIKIVEVAATVTQGKTDIVGQLLLQGIKQVKDLIGQLTKDSLVHILFVSPQAGGNQGFYNTVVDSMRDSGDPNKPSYGPSDYISATVGVFGVSAGNVTRTIDMVSALLQLGKHMSVKPTQDIPRPRNLRYRLNTSPRVSADRPIAIIGSKLLQAPDGVVTGQRGSVPVGVFLEWDARPVVVEFLGGKYKINKVHVYRHTTNFDDKQAADHLYKTIRFGSSVYPGCVDNEVDPSKVYYYAVGFEYSDSTSGKAVEQIAISNTIRVDLPTLTRDGIPTTRTGNPPDWYGLQNPIHLFPAAVDFISTVLAYIDTVTPAAQGGDAQTKATIAYVKKMIQNNVKTVQQMNNQLKLLKDILHPISLGVNLMACAGKGGNAEFADHLRQALQDQTDPDRPPYDTSTDYVGGFVILAGGRIAPTDDYLSLFDALVKPVDAKGFRDAFDSLDTLGKRTREELEKLLSEPWADDMSGPVKQPGLVPAPAESPFTAGVIGMAEDEEACIIRGTDGDPEDGEDIP